MISRYTAERFHVGAIKYSSTFILADHASTIGRRAELHDDARTKHLYPCCGHKVLYLLSLFFGMSFKLSCMNLRSSFLLGIV